MKSFIKESIIAYQQKQQQQALKDKKQRQRDAQVVKSAVNQLTHIMGKNGYQFLIARRPVDVTFNDIHSAITKISTSAVEINICWMLDKDSNKIVVGSVNISIKFSVYRESFDNGFTSLNWPPDQFTIGCQNSVELKEYVGQLFADFPEAMTYLFCS